MDRMGMDIVDLSRVDLKKLRAWIGHSMWSDRENASREKYRSFVACRQWGHGKEATRDINGPVESM